MGKFFSIEELCRSNTAKQKGIENTPSQEVIDNLNKLIDNVLDPLREWYGKPIHIESGYRCPELNRAVGGVSNSFHCFDENTELLTLQGWKKYNELEEGELIYSYSMNNNKLEITSIDEIISYQYEGPMLEVINKHIDLLVTMKHRMLVRHPSWNFYKRKNSRELSEKEQKYFDSLKKSKDYVIELAQDIKGKQKQFMCASTIDELNVIDVSIDFVKLLIAVITDGHFCYRYSKDKEKIVCGVQFIFKKERKISHIQSLLKRLNLNYTFHIRKTDGATIISINNTQLAQEIFSNISKEKNLPKWIEYLGSEKIKEILLEFAFFDGCHDLRENCETFVCTTTNKRNKDELMILGFLSNMRTHCCEIKEREYHINNTKGKAKKVYTISFHKTRFETVIYSQHYQIKQYKGIVWCANNKNTTVIVRRNNKISIQGNCKGYAADIDMGDKEDNLPIFNYIKDNLPFTELGWEGGGRWVHVAYKENQIDKEVFSA